MHKQIKTFKENPYCPTVDLEFAPYEGDCLDMNIAIPSYGRPQMVWRTIKQVRYDVELLLPIYIFVVEE